MDEQCDVAVIGSGIGGLTTAAMLAKRGLHVIVLEQHSVPGGFCHGWTAFRRAGNTRVRYDFDATVHDISGVFEGGSVTSILDRLGLRSAIQWTRTSHEYWLPTGSVRVGQDHHEYVEFLARRYPGDGVGVERLFGLLAQCYGELYENAPNTGGLPRAPADVHEVLHFRRTCPTLAKLLNSSFVSVRDSFISDPELRTLVSILASYVTDDVRQLSFIQALPLFGYYFKGGHYPLGGSRRLPEELVGAISRYGGVVRMKTEVRTICRHRGTATGVRLADGRMLGARAVVSNADTAATCALIEEAGPEHCLPYEPTNSAFILHLGIDTRLDIAPTTIMLDVGGGGAILSSPPGAGERAPEGHSTLTITALVPAREASAWRRSQTDYRYRKREAGDRLIALAERRIPQLSRHIALRAEGSPATLHRYTRATNGAAYGATPARRVPTSDGPLDGLFLVGASTGLGPGVEAVMIGGVVVAERVWEWVSRESSSSNTRTTA